MEDSKKTTCILTHPDPSARETLVGIFASASLTVSAVCADWAGALDAAARVLPEMIFVHALAAGLDAGTATAQVDRLRLSRRPAIVYLVPSYLPERATIMVTHTAKRLRCSQNTASLFTAQMKAAR